MNKQLLKDGIGWGVGLWLFGYLLGFALFMVVPVEHIGWFILPIGTVVAWWVVAKKINSSVFSYFVMVALIWVLIAAAFDYIFLVQLLKPADGYYKLDIYLYYLLTLLLPLVVGWLKTQPRVPSVKKV